MHQKALVIVIGKRPDRPFMFWKREEVGIERQVKQLKFGRSAVIWHAAGLPEPRQGNPFSLLFQVAPSG